MYKENKEALSGNDQYEGYNVDLVEHISKGPSRYMMSTDYWDFTDVLSYSDTAWTGPKCHCRQASP